MAISVLIVEDDKNIQSLLQMYLEKEGYAVTVADDGGQGLIKFRSIKPDLVLLDVKGSALSIRPLSSCSPLRVRLMIRSTACVAVLMTISPSPSR